ncbi:hypothetical protein ACS0TY_023923 [Phlomoides rotata]
MMKPIIYNLSNHRSDVYEVEGDIRIHGKSSTIFIASSTNFTSWLIKPYAQKMNTAKFRSVTNFTIKLEATDAIPHCTQNLNHIPAVVFSGKGHALNLFHAFADVLFPLFLTCHRFNRSIIFLVTNHYSPWTSRYRAILQKLSEYDVYDIDKENQVLCFSKMIIGLRTPGALFIHPEESRNFSIGSFRKLIRSAYSLEREFIDRRTGDRPRLLIISREGSRRLMNEGKIRNMARGLGFEVVVKRMVPNVSMSLTAQHVNSFDVLLGVHGAGLTNMLFLPRNAVLLQIIPFGLDIEAYVCYEWPAVSMKLRYLEYKVSLNESSLLGKYDDDVEVYTHPATIREKHNHHFRTVYLDNQDVAPDLHRFQKTLLRALEFVRA